MSFIGTCLPVHRCRRQILGFDFRGWVHFPAGMIMRNIAQVGSLLVAGRVHLWPLVAPIVQRKTGPRTPRPVEPPQRDGFPGFASRTWWDRQLSGQSTLTCSSQSGKTDSEWCLPLDHPSRGLHPHRPGILLAPFDRSGHSGTRTFFRVRFGCAQCQGRIAYRVMMCL